MLRSTSVEPLNAGVVVQSHCFYAGWQVYGAKVLGKTVVRKKRLGKPYNYLSRKKGKGAAVIS